MRHKDDLAGMVFYVAKEYFARSAAHDCFRLDYFYFLPQDLSCDTGGRHAVISVFGIMDGRMAVAQFDVAFFKVAVDNIVRVRPRKYRDIS